MEDKKTLWIILGIGVCVLVVAAVGFFWFLPDDGSIASSEGETPAVQTGKAGFDPVEWVRNSEDFPGLEQKEEQPEEFVVISDELIYGIPEEKTESSIETESVGEDKEITLETVRPVVEKAVVEINPAAVQRVRPRPQETVVKKATARTEYWIQAGSFSSLQKARDVKNKLNNMGTVSTVSTTNVNGTNFYRVRLGPYTEKPEAEKFLDWIKDVDGFGGSYISEVYVTK